MVDREPRERFELSPGVEIQLTLLEEIYPASEAPWVESILDAYYQAARDIVRHSKNGELPPEMWRRVRSLREGPGLVTIYVDGDGVGIAPTADGAVRIGTRKEGETEVMDLAELEDADWQALLSDPDLAAEIVSQVVRFGDFVDAEALIRCAVEREDIELDADDLRQLADEIETSV